MQLREKHLHDQGRRIGEIIFDFVREHLNHSMTNSSMITDGLVRIDLVCHSCKKRVQINAESRKEAEE
jgi:hypothetical protein